MKLKHTSGPKHTVPLCSTELLGTSEMKVKLEDVPDDVLFKILARQTISARCALACTSKHFNRLCMSAPLDTIVLDIGKLPLKGSSNFAAMLSFLTKRVTKSTRVNLICSSPQPDAHARSGHSGSAEWSSLSVVSLLMGVGINVGISCLSLRLDGNYMDEQSTALQYEVLKTLPWLTELKNLTVTDIIQTNVSQLNAFSRLCELEKLALEFNPSAAQILRQSLQGGFPDKLCSLRNLSHLSIRSAGFLGDLPPELGELAKLEHLSLGNGSIVTGLPDTLSKLNRLCSVRLEHFGNKELSALALLPSLNKLHLTSCRMPTELAGCSKLTALTLLLGNVPEHQIEAGFSKMLGFTEQPHAWHQLLPKMPLNPNRLENRLRVLHIADTKLGSVPQAVTQLPNLLHLSLTQCSLIDLPEGPYISNLETLKLKQNFFIEVPKVLARAGKLCKLDLSQNNLLKFSESDIKTVLQMPQLNHLWVSKSVPLTGPERFGQNLTSWTAYSVQCLIQLSTRYASKFPAEPLRVHIFEASPAQMC